jgi:hypothetical protein
VLFQARHELIEQIVELIGVIDKKRVPGILKKFKSRTGNTFSASPEIAAPNPWSRPRSASAC